MGYASLTQIDNGIHLRQFSRAFIFADAKKQSRVVFVNADVCMATQIMKIQVYKFNVHHCAWIGFSNIPSGHQEASKHLWRYVYR